MVPLPVSRDVDIWQKSKMAVAKWNVHILRLYGWWKTISNTQWANFKCPRTQRKQKRQHMEQTCRRQITKMVSRSRSKPEVVITSATN